MKDIHNREKENEREYRKWENSSSDNQVWNTDTDQTLQEIKASYQESWEPAIQLNWHHEWD